MRDNGQTIVLPIPLQSKAFAITTRFDTNTGDVTKQVKPIRITEVTLWANGEVRHYISGNHKYLAKNVFPSKEEAERILSDA